jgi:hypothetical protein
LGQRFQRWQARRRGSRNTTVEEPAFLTSPTGTRSIDERKGTH